MEQLARYPFLNESVEYVRSKGWSLGDLEHLNTPQTRAMQRVMDALMSNPESTPVSSDYELFSYPIAKLIVGTIDSDLLRKRFVVNEAKRSYNYLMKNDEDIDFVARSLHVPYRREMEYIVKFPVYLHYTWRQRDSEWKLVNRKMVAGEVYLDKKSFARLLEDAILDTIKFEPVPAELKKEIEPWTIDAREVLSVYEIEGNSEITQDAFPPCIAMLLKELQSGINLPHSARFALTSFLYDIGMTADGVMDLYRKAPDFREDRTRYQVDHIFHGEYVCPTCRTMQTYGNCRGKNPYCENLTNPLVYYRRRSRKR